jgi:hypothetical protein
MTTENPSPERHLTDEQVWTLNERHGWFQYRDAQSDVSRQFAHDAIEMYLQTQREAATQARHSPEGADVLADIDAAQEQLRIYGCEFRVRDGLCRARMKVASLLSRNAELEAARHAYASEFRPNSDGDPDVGSIHANIRALKSERDGIAAENKAMQADAELFRWMETHVAAWHCKEAALPRFVVDPRFTDETGEECSLIVTGSDGVGTVSLRTAILMMRRSKTENTIAALARTPAAGDRT